MLCSMKIQVFLVLMPRRQPPRFIWSVRKWRTAVPFVKTISMKCCHVWLPNPDWWLQRARDVLWLRHRTSRSGSSQLCWKVPYVTTWRIFLPVPHGIWTSLLLVSCAWRWSPVALPCYVQTGANYSRGISALPDLLVLGVICMVYKQKSVFSAIVPLMSGLKL